MSGLAEILAENQRLRESLAARELVIAAQDQALNEKDQALSEAHREIALKAAMVEALKSSSEELAQKLALIEQRQQGPASHRYIPPEQGQLPFPGDVAAPPRMPVREEDDEPEDEQVNDSRQKKSDKGKKKPRRRDRDAVSHIRSRKVRCPADPNASCAKCGGELKVIGQGESFRVEWVPGHFVVDEVERDKCACPNCPGEGVLTVPAPYALPRALCGDGLLARILVAKFGDHMPLNRQAKQMGREGFEVGSNTMSGWVGQVGKLLRHVAKAVRAELLKSPFLQGDDTGHPIQDGGDGHLRKGRLWVFTDQQQAFYAFTPTKEGKFPAALLAGFEGELLLVDGGSEFNEVVAEQDIKRGGCWSHLRKYFYEARLQSPAESAQALAVIKDLFLFERTIWGQEPDTIRDARTKMAKPVVDGFFTWVKAISTGVRPKSLLARAVTYAINQENPLRLYLDNPELPMHNNLSELMLRQPVVGRKNWLFNRTEGGAEVAADCYTLIQSCMLQGIDPHEYLVDVLKRLPDHPSNRVGELTPQAWAREKRRT